MEAQPGRALVGGEVIVEGSGEVVPDEGSRGTGGQSSEADKGGSPHGQPNTKKRGFSRNRSRVHPKMLGLPVETANKRQVVFICSLVTVSYHVSRRIFCVGDSGSELADDSQLPNGLAVAQHVARLQRRVEGRYGG